jgi:hypothetical protein
MVLDFLVRMLWFNMNTWLASKTEVKLKSFVLEYHFRTSTKSDMRIYFLLFSQQK